MTPYSRCSQVLRGVRRAGHPCVLAAALLAIAPVTAFEQSASAQETEAAQPAPPPAPKSVKPQPVRTPQGTRQAVAREGRPSNEGAGRDRAEARPAPAPAPAPAATAEGAAQPQQVAADAQRRNGGGRAREGNPQTGGATQRGDRPRGDNPSTGRAVPRDSRPAPSQVRPNGGRPTAGRPNGGRNIYIAPPVRNYYSYPRTYYPYGYGAFGLGYFYYDPYTWYPPSNYGGEYAGGYDNGYYDLGEVRLAVSPRSADVYVDGYYAGRVDSFDGIFQALKLEAGTHHLQVVAPGYLPLDVDIRLNPGQKITYRGDLRR